MTSHAPTSTTRWANPRLESDWSANHTCGSRHSEAYDPVTHEPLTDKRSQMILMTHAATHVGELVDTETGEVVRQPLCSNAAAAFAARWGLQFPVV